MLRAFAGHRGAAARAVIPADSFAGQRMTTKNTPASRQQCGRSMATGAGYPLTQKPSIKRQHGQMPPWPRREETAHNNNNNNNVRIVRTRSLDPFTITTKPVHFHHHE